MRILLATLTGQGANEKRGGDSVFTGRAAETIELTLGMQIDRTMSAGGCHTSALLRMTREEARANPYARFAGLFFPPRPRFRFSPGEQRLLEYALLEVSHDEAVH